MPVGSAYSTVTNGGAVYNPIPIGSIVGTGTVGAFATKYSSKMPHIPATCLIAGVLVFGVTTVNAGQHQRSSSGAQKSLARSSWPMSRADARNTAQGQGRGAKGKLKWRFKTHSSITATPVLSGSGILYLGSDDEKVYALEAATGKQYQKFHFGKDQRGPGVRNDFGTPLITKSGTVIVGSTNSSVYALDGKTGKKKWEYAAASIVGAPPTMGPDGTLYIGCNGARLYALSADTGKAKWIFSTADSIQSASAVWNDTVYVTSRDRHVYAVNARTGALRWKYMSGPDTFHDAFFSSPAVGSDGTVYAACENGFLYALKGGTGGLLWKIYLGSRPSSPAISSDGIIYVGAGRVYAIRSSGQRVWASRSVAGFAGPVVASDNTVYVGSSDHRVYAFNGRTGHVKWTFATGGYIVSCPAIDNQGAIYVGADDGYLYAIR